MRNGKEMKNLLFYSLVKNYHMYSNKYIKTVSKFIEILTENKKHRMNYVYILLQWQVKNSASGYIYIS